MFAIEHSRAIIVFAELEEQLCGFAAYQVGKGSAVAIRTAMYGIESFRAKLEFVSRLTRVFLEEKPDLIERWGKVENSMKKANQRRNEVVHQTKRVFPKSPPGRRVVLVPPIMNPLALKGDKGKKMSSEEPAPDHALGVRQLVEARVVAQDARGKLGSIWGLMKDGKDRYEGVDPPKAETLREMITEYRRSARATIV